MNENNLNKLISEALAIEAEAAQEAGTLGYMARVFSQASLPHSKVSGNEYKRTNGAMTMRVLAPSEIGVPYGSYPRLLMSWLTTEAVRTKDSVLVLGHTLSEFMDCLGLLPTGGRWGTMPRLRNQMIRLFSSMISCTYQDGTRNAGMGAQVAKAYDLWWDPNAPEQAALWQSTVALSLDFFNEIVDKPVPVDMRVLKAIKQSAMKLDIYCWLTYRMSYLKRHTEVPWELLQLQFGSGFTRTRAFKEAFTEHLKGVLLLYPAAKVEDGNKGLILKPSPPHIKKLIKS